MSLSWPHSNFAFATFLIDYQGNEDSVTIRPREECLKLFMKNIMLTWQAVGCLCSLTRRNFNVSHCFLRIPVTKLARAKLTQAIKSWLPDIHFFLKLAKDSSLLKRLRDVARHQIFQDREGWLSDCRVTVGSLAPDRNDARLPARLYHYSKN